MTNNDNHEKQEIQSDDPIIQKCLDIIRNEKTIVIKPFQKHGDFYVAYIKNGELFSFVPEYSILGKTWKHTIRINNDKQPIVFYGKRSSDLIELHKLCDEKYFKRKEAQKEWRRKYYPIILASALGVGMLVFGWSRIHKKDNVDKQVEAFEKTLPPEYLEYKQAVEHYRDSLMHAKRR